MPSFMKDELKKKDEEMLEEMQREIDEAELAGEAADDTCEETAEGNHEGTEEAENGADDPAKRAEKLEADLAEKDAQMLRLRADCHCLLSGHFCKSSSYARIAPLIFCKEDFASSVCPLR